MEAQQPKVLDENLPSREPVHTSAPTISRRVSDEQSNLPPVIAHRSASTYLLYLVFLFVGVLLGYTFFISYPVPLQRNYLPLANSPLNQGSMLLPNDAVQIQSCADFKGALYASPKNIPNGPVFMVYKSQIIGVEFMLGEREFIQGKSFENFAGMKAKINHVNIGYMETGHEGYPGPHYHVDLYSVDKMTERSIVCPTSTDMMMPISSQSASASSSSLLSGTISPSMPIISPASSSSMMMK